MTEDAIKARAVGYLPRDSSGQSTFDPVTLLVLSAIISTAVSWIVERCLNRLFPADVQRPGFLVRQRLKSVVRTACKDVATTADARRLGLDDVALYRRYGEDVHAALLATGRGLTDDEFHAFKNQCLGGSQ